MIEIEIFTTIVLLILPPLTFLLGLVIFFIIPKKRKLGKNLMKIGLLYIAIAILIGWSICSNA